MNVTCVLLKKFQNQIAIEHTSHTRIYFIFESVKPVSKYKWRISLCFMGRKPKKRTNEYIKNLYGGSKLIHSLGKILLERIFIDINDHSTIMLTQSSISH